MLKPFKLYCPTKDKTVSLTVNYILAGCHEDVRKTPYVKGTPQSCSACNGQMCCSCEPHNQLDDGIYI